MLYFEHISCMSFNLFLRNILIMLLEVACKCRVIILGGICSSGEDKGRARRAQHDQFFYLKLFFSMPIMDDKMPILRGAF